MKMIKAKQTLHSGHYGMKAAGDEFEVHNTVADSLIERGLADLVKDNGADTKTEQQLQEEKTIAANKAIDKKTIAKEQGEKQPKK